MVRESIYSLDRVKERTERPKARQETRTRPRCIIRGKGLPWTSELTPEAIKQAKAHFRVKGHGCMQENTNRLAAAPKTAGEQK